MLCLLSPTNQLNSTYRMLRILDTLICQMQEVASQSLFYLCVDFNARISNFDDFISRVDFIPERRVVDFNSN